MAISKISPSGVNVNPETRSICITLANTFTLSVFMLSALDLFVASIRGDSLANYIGFVLTDIAIILVGLIFSLDLVVKGFRNSLSCFIGYMLFIWSCVTIIKLIFLA